MSQDLNTEALAKINKRFVADDQKDKLPAVTLPDGSKIQTGTLGALLQYIKMYDRLCAGEQIEEGVCSLCEPLLPCPQLTGPSFYQGGS